MYRIHGGNTIIYETFTELMKENIVWMSEYGEFYYIKLLKEYNDDSVWKVDKRTEQASYMQYIDYMLDIQDKATPVDPAMLRKLRKGA